MASVATPQTPARRPTRSAVRYHGGKWLLSDWIIGHFPSHRTYVEPFGGGASVLLRKPRAYAEIYNDLNGEIVNLFRVIRDQGAALRDLIALTPFSRAEFQQSYEASDDCLEQARRTLVRSFQGFGSAAICGERSGFRASSARSGSLPARDWSTYPTSMALTIERLQGVVIEQTDAIAVMRQHDSPETLHYVDPPYVHATRSAKKRATATGRAYAYEMGESEHTELADALASLSGTVVISGYRCPLYDRLFRNWTRFDKATFADGATARTESLWINREPRQRQLDFG